jgi:hypothetical protein
MLCPYLSSSWPSWCPSKIAVGSGDATPKTVTPECFNRGSSPNSTWIPAKSMRE